ncbi:hypothetical protein JQX13_32035 [Archangium violaceum]|nr:hypothetical protein JQX13_32035 [Archangium violaceum]
MQALLSGLSLVWLLVLFAGLALVVGFAGTHMAKTADILADRTGLGETLMGAVFIGASTSLSGITTSITAAASGAPTMAISNTIGGIAVQTAFLAVADLTSRNRANLLVRCASPSALYQGVLQMGLLTLALLGALAPPWPSGASAPCRSCCCSPTSPACTSCEARTTAPSTTRSARRRRRTRRRRGRSPTRVPPPAGCGGPSPWTRPSPPWPGGASGRWASHSSNAPGSRRRPWGGCSRPSPPPCRSW